jgi:hypothetical protein
VFRLLDKLPGTRLRPASDSRYAVFSPERRPDLLAKLKREKWEEVASIPGEPTRSRALIARLLAWVPSQQERASKMTHPPGLIILANPNPPAGGSREMARGRSRVHEPGPPISGGEEGLTLSSRSIVGRRADESPKQGDWETWQRQK